MLRHSRRFAVVLFLAVLGPATAAHALVTDVEPGYDLLTTGAGTTFLGNPFTGVPIGSYNF